MTSLHGERVQLRHLAAGDLDTLWRWENRSENWQYSSVPNYHSKDDLAQMVQEAPKDILETGQVRFIIEIDSGVAIGTLDFFDFDPVHQRLGVGVLVAESQYRQQGYAFEAMQLGLTFAFEQWALHQVYAQVLENNLSSKRLFEKLGFVKAGVLKDWVNLEGNFVDQGLYQKMKDG